MEPYIEESLYQAALERASRLRRKRCPRCIICNRVIEDDRCYILDAFNGFDSAIHKECMRDQIKKMKKAKLNEDIIDWLEDELDYNFEVSTPLQEE